MGYKQKNNYFQFIRGICILAVVLIHCKTDTGIPFSSFSATINLFLRSMIAFPVAILFYISGRFTHIPKDVADKPYNLTKRIFRILIPYLIFSCLYIVFGCIQRQTYTLTDISRILLTGEAAMPFWYSICLLWMTLVTPLLILSVKNKRPIGIFVAISVLFQIMGYLTTALFGKSQWVKYSPIWIIFYYFGMLVGNDYITIKSKYVKVHVGIIMVGAYCISALESYILLNTQVMKDIAYSQWHIGAFVWAFTLIIILENYIQEYKGNKVLVKIGNDSYGVYFIHPLYISIFNAVINRINCTLPFLLLVFIQFIFTVSCTMATVNLIKRMFRDSVRLKLLGF